MSHLEKPRNMKRMFREFSKIFETEPSTVRIKSFPTLNLTEEMVWNLEKGRKIMNFTTCQHHSAQFGTLTSL